MTGDAVGEFEYLRVMQTCSSFNACVYDRYDIDKYLNNYS